MSSANLSFEDFSARALRLQSLRARVDGAIQDEVDAIVSDIDASIRHIRSAIFGYAGDHAGDDEERA